MSYGVRGAKASHTGFSIVEMMVAMTVSLVLLGGALSLLYSSKVTYYENERVARNQEGGRTAVELILRDLRAAGFPGCAQPVSGLFSANNRLANSSLLLWRFDVPLEGFEGSNGTWAPTLDTLLSGATPAPSPKNDIVVVRTVRAGAPQFRTTGFTSPTADIVVSKSASQSISAGATFVINDCGGESFFAATPVATTATTATLRLGTGGSAPTNQSNDLLASFTAGAQVSPVDTLIYYVALSATPSTQGGQPGPALWRIVGNQNPEEVISGVERLEVQYGVDTNRDAVVDQYSNADVVNAAGNWSNVISIKIAVLVRSAEPNAPENDKKTYMLLDTSAGPFNDRYERSVFMTTAALRNRAT